MPWIKIPCVECNGHGIIADYGWFGDDFFGDKECPFCEGKGTQSLHEETGTIAVYPGGPFRGRKLNKTGV